MIYSVWTNISQLPHGKKIKSHYYSTAKGSKFLKSIRNILPESIGIQLNLKPTEQMDNF